MKIQKVWWSQQSEITVALTRDCAFVPRVLFDNADGLRALSVSRSSPRKFAKYSSYYVEGSKAHFLISRRSFPNAERGVNYYLCGDFNGWGRAIGDAKWLMRELEDDHDFYCELVLDLAQFDRRKVLQRFKFASDCGVWLEPSSDVVNLDFDAHRNANLLLDLRRTGAHAFVVKTSSPCRMGGAVGIELPELGLSAKVDELLLLLKIRSSSPLGAGLENGVSVFRIFAPRADAVYVRYKKFGERSEHILQASTRDGAVWTARANADLSGCLYCFSIGGTNADSTTAFDRRAIVADPYANAAPDSKGWCIVKYDSDLPVVRDSFTAPRWHDLVVVEAHIRDVLARARADLNEGERLGFAGLSKWLSSEDCYLRRCGANCVELQPIQEFTYENKTDYEWGYMPVNWHAPSSAYASAPEMATQNDEFAELVRAFHAAGLAVVLDVVYNHYGEPNFLRFVDKQYYFESGVAGNLSNYSGCGNDFRADAPMGRRLILDSLKKLVLNYGVDGFRFDLAELLGVDVLREIERELKKIKPSVILIAEPWSFRGHIAHRLKSTGWASWNDGFREFSLQYAKGFGNFDGFKYFMKGSRGGFASFPAQTVNYVESHDDMCLLDRITSLHEDPSVDDLRRFKLAYAFTLLAHGIPMLAEGFDLARTKYGKNNTYKDGIANALDYDRGLRFGGVCNWLRSFVKFRLSPRAAALRRDRFDGDGFFSFYRSAESDAVSACMFNRGGFDKSCPSIFAAFNPTDNPAEFFVDNDLRGFVQIADIDTFDESGLLLDSPVSNGILRMQKTSFALFLGR